MRSSSTLAPGGGCEAASSASTWERPKNRADELSGSVFEASSSCLPMSRQSWPECVASVKRSNFTAPKRAQVGMRNVVWITVRFRWRLSINSDATFAASAGEMDGVSATSLSEFGLSTADVPIAGLCAPEFEAVREQFERNFADGGEMGAAVATWVDGELVVNLWGGWKDAACERPWQQDTLASVFSGSKGLTSTCVHLLAERGLIDLHEPVAAYWPEFAQSGKEAITVAMVMAHRSGVIGPQHRLEPDEVLDWDRVCAELAAAEPWWTPGTAQGYHMVTFGFILGELLRRVTGRTVGEFLREHIAGPLSADLFIGLPAHEHARCADMINKPRVRDVLAAGGAPANPTSLAEHGKAGLAVATDFIPDDEIGSRA